MRSQIAPASGTMRLTGLHCGRHPQVVAGLRAVGAIAVATMVFRPAHGTAAGVREPRAASRTACLGMHATGATMCHPEFCSRQRRLSQHDTLPPRRSGRQCSRNVGPVEPGLPRIRNRRTARRFEGRSPGRFPLFRAMMECGFGRFRSRGHLYKGHSAGSGTACRSVDADGGECAKRRISVTVRG